VTKSNQVGGGMREGIVEIQLAGALDELSAEGRKQKGSVRVEGGRKMWHSEAIGSERVYFFLLS